MAEWNKIITSGGGGMILTNDIKIANRAKYLTTQAKDDPIKYIHKDIGYNFRLSNIQAALGLAQLENLPKRIRKKKIIQSIYRSKINKNKGLKISDVSNPNKSNYWLNILEINKEITKKNFSKLFIDLINMEQK